MRITADKISEKTLRRIQRLDKKMPIDGSKFYKMAIEDRIDYVNEKVE